MTIKTTALFCLASAFAFVAPVAQAATCADRSQVVGALADRFGETLLGNAVSNSGEVLEIYSNTDSDTWTILVTLPDRGLSCLVASGTGQRQLGTQLANLES